MTTRRDLVEALQDAGCPVEAGADGTYFITSHLVRIRAPVPTAYVHPGADKDVLRNAIVDAVHWALHRCGGAAVRVAFPEGAVDWETEQAIATLAAVAASKVRIATYRVDHGTVTCVPWTPARPAFASDPRPAEWAASLDKRSTSALPVEAQHLAAALAATVPSFRWYRNVTANAWSGRVAGWQICSQTPRGGCIRFGRTDAIRRAEPPYDGRRIQALAARVSAFAEERADPTRPAGKDKREHLVEAALWRGAAVLPLTPPRAARPLDPLVPPSSPPLQVPTLFGASPPGGRTCPVRYVDAVMVDGTIPWVVELKVPSDGEGQYYRHAVTQAVLYREFLRAEARLHPWFASHGVDARMFEAAIAFPRLGGTGTGRQRHILDQLRDTAGVFGVEVVELDEDFADIQRRTVP